jgi:hypothetical protein
MSVSFSDVNGYGIGQSEYPLPWRVRDIPARQRGDVGLERLETLAVLGVGKAPRISMKMEDAVHELLVIAVDPVDHLFGAGDDWRGRGEERPFVALAFTEAEKAEVFGQQGVVDYLTKAVVG